MQRGENHAETAYRRALHADANHPAALLGLGRVFFGLDQYDHALSTLQRVPFGRPERAKAEGWIAKANFRRQAALSGGEVEARCRLAAKPDDLDARQAMLSLFTVLGDDHQLTQEYRPQLAMLLFWRELVPMSVPGQQSV